MSQNHKETYTISTSHNHNPHQPQWRQQQLLHTNSQYLDKSVVVELNGGRSVSGVLRGYDVFMNVTLAEALEHSKKDKLLLGTVVIRGNSILSVEATA